MRWELRAMMSVVIRTCVWPLQNWEVWLSQRLSLIPDLAMLHGMPSFVTCMQPQPKLAYQFAVKYVAFLHITSKRADIAAVWECLLMCNDFQGLSVNTVMGQNGTKDNVNDQGWFQ